MFKPFKQDILFGSWGVFTSFTLQPWISIATGFVGGEPGVNQGSAMGFDMHQTLGI
jgi:hypothetical protein